MQIEKLLRSLLFLSTLLSFILFCPVHSTGETNPVIVMETSKGDITIELFEKMAPITVRNFLSYVDDGFYNNLMFHRVITGFMVQGGGFDKDMNRRATRPPIKNEAKSELPNTRGTIAMARTNVVDSATSQFFINLVDNGFLNHKDNSPRGFGYAVFGKVITGMDVVDAISKVKTGSRGGMQDVPLETVLIKNVRRHTPPPPPSLSVQ